MGAYMLCLMAACSAPDQERSERATPAGKSGEGAESRPQGEQRQGGPEARGAGRGGSSRGGAGGFAPPESAGESGVPVEIATIEAGVISSFFETNSTLEAENEVDIVARVSGPIVELEVEEGDRVKVDQSLARLDDRELRAQLDAAEIRLEQARASFARTRSLFDQELVSRDLFDQARAGAETARADAERLRIQLDYMTIRAPFGGLVVERYVKFAEFVQNGSRLFRLADFDPLLAPIQVPERHLLRLKAGQRAQLRVEAFGERIFKADVLRIRPVVDAQSGTIEVTLKVRGESVLQPGMFSSVELEMERREDVVMVPKAALALDSLRPTVFAVGRDADGNAVAERRELAIGLRNDQFLEVLEGLGVGERVVVIGQDGLADGTPLELPDQTAGPAPTAESRTEQGRGASRRGEGGERRGPPAFMLELDWNDPEQVEKVKERMRQRGLSDSKIEERLERMKERFSGEGGEGGEGGRQGAGS